MLIAIAVLITSFAPLVAWALWKLGIDRAKYISLLVILPSILVISDFLTCNVRSLEEWYWLNCGTSPLERLFAALTMPSVVIPLTAFVLALIGLREARGVFFYLSTLLSVSLLFYWSVYLELNYPMLLMPPKLPPLGYGVVRSFFFFLYLPLYSLGSVLAFSYLIVRKVRYLKLALLLEALSLLLASFWGLYGFGVPLPLTLYHLGLWLTFLNTLAMLHDSGNLSALAFLSALLITSVIPRAYITGFGGMPSPFFALQTSIAVAYSMLIITGLIEILKNPLKRKSNVMLGIEITSLALLALSVFDYSFNFLFATSPAVSLYVSAAAVVLIAANLALSPYLLSKKKIALTSPALLVHPIIGFLGSLLIPIYFVLKDRNVLKALMVASSLSIALLMLYGSSFYLFTPYKATELVKAGKTLTTSVSKYKGNITVVRFHYVYKFNSTKTNSTVLRIPLFIHINVFMNKYLAPNEIPYFSWSVPQWRGLATCSLSARSFLGKPAPNVDYYYLMCTPLGIEGILAPSIAFITILFSLGFGGSRTTESEREPEGNASK